MVDRLRSRKSLFKRTLVQLVRGICVCDIFVADVPNSSAKSRTCLVMWE